MKAQKLNVPLGNVFDTLQVYLGSLYVNDLNRFGRTFQVRAQAEGEFRSEPEQVVRLKTRNVDGEMVPLGSLVDLHVSDPRVLRPPAAIDPAAPLEKRSRRRAAQTPGAGSTREGAALLGLLRLG